MSYRRRRRDPIGDLIGFIILLALLVALTSHSWLSSDTLAQFGIGFAISGGAAGAIIFAFMYAAKRKRQAAFLALELIDADNMTGREFEKFMAEVFKKRGYHVKETVTTGDYGVDLLIKKDGITTAVQLKRYHGKVGLKAVQEAVAGMQYYKCHQAMVLTNSIFTGAAHNLARANHCQLVSRNQLAEWILEYKNN
jgi:restriction system protein